MIDVIDKTEVKLVRLSKQVTNNEYIITIIKEGQVMQIRLKERKVKLEKFIKTVEIFQGTGREIEMKVQGIMTFVSVEIVVTDVENIKDQLRHVQVSTGKYFLTSCLHFAALAYALTGRNNPARKKKLNSEPKKGFQTYLSKIICSFLLSAFKYLLFFKNMQNSWVAKSLMSHTFAVKIGVFKHVSHKIKTRC